MLDQLEQAYLELFWKQQRLQYENYSDGASHDLAEANQALHELLRPAEGLSEAGTRRARILCDIRRRVLVDYSGDAARLRNALDRKFSGFWLFPAEERTMGRRIGLAREIKDDVLALMRIRDAKARELGFSGYVELVLACDGIDCKSLWQRLESFVHNGAPRAAQLAAKHGVRVETWYADIAKTGRLSSEVDAEELVRRLLARLGISGADKQIRILCSDNGPSGFAAVLSVPDDIRLFVSPVVSISGVLTLFHELGHGAAHAMNHETGIYKTWSPACDEAMAAVMEYVGRHMESDVFSVELCDEVQFLRDMECAVSALFELDLWRRPEEAEELYEKHFSKLGAPVPEPEIWAADCFRSLDPVYKHNYVLGRHAGERTAAHLQKEYGEDFASWGQWLKENYYADGRKRNLGEKMSVLAETAECSRMGGDLNSC
jgi:hypothetical protein